MGHVVRLASALLASIPIPRGGRGACMHGAAAYSAGLKDCAGLGAARGSLSSVCFALFGCVLLIQLDGRPFWQLILHVAARSRTYTRSAPRTAGAPWTMRHRPCRL